MKAVHVKSHRKQSPLVAALGPRSESAQAKDDKNVEASWQLGPGMHLAMVEVLTEAGFGVRLLDGRRGRAQLSPYVHRALVEECVRSQRPMLLCDTQEGPQIVGALQVAPSIAPDLDGNLTIAARSVRVEAEENLRFEAGRSELRMNADGRTRLKAERTVLDVASNLRIYSALVELP